MESPDNFIDCDGKKCGEGKHAGGTTYVCPHNNLAVKYPELIPEWHFENKPMENYSPGSNVKVIWICSKHHCGCHIWGAKIVDRTKKSKTGCPYCINKKLCPHNNLGALYPYLKIEWHPNNKPISEYPPKSGQKVKWVCPKNPCGCHIYEARIADRTHPTETNDCPYCSRHKTCDHDNLETAYPQLIPEWHIENKPMKTYAPSSSAKVKWICSNENRCCEHEWFSIISNRTGTHNNGCPFCAGKQLCKHNNLEYKCPELKIEWHPDNKPMKSFSFGTHTKVKWICPKNPCGCHIYEATIHSRTSNHSNCPYCSHYELCVHNNLKTLFPNLILEWHPDNKLMDTYPPGSDEIVKWICSKNNKHIWPTSICHRTNPNKSTECPHCVNSKGYSKMQIDWIKDIEIKENIKIQHALCEEGEYYIKNIGKVDGYCRDTNTVYEFHGDFWHGNPIIYKSDEINNVSKVTFGKLYNKTIERDNKIKELGYNLIIIWELDYVKL